MMQENIVTVPNVLSLGRIVLSPILGYLVITSHFSIAFGLFAVAGLSDMVSIN
jgi:cardiolipin synthase